MYTSSQPDVKESAISNASIVEGLDDFKRQPVVQVTQIGVTAGRLSEKNLNTSHDSEANIVCKEDLDRYLTAYPFPGIAQPLWLTRVRFHFFTVYRRLCTIVLVINITALAILASKGQRTPFSHAAIGAASNVLAAVLARHEPIVNIVVGVVKYVPLTWPLWIRRRLGKIYCHAGIHSGCGISAAMWYVYFTSLLFLHPITVNKQVWIGAYFITALLLLCLLAMVGLAHPWFRMHYHDIWELSHRYLGWAITVLFFIQVMLLAHLSELPFGTAVLRSPLFWMVLVVIYAIIYPWALLRKRTFIAHQLSNHALRLEFDYRSSRTGHNIRLSHSPLVENHGFATIPRGGGESGFSVIISNAGDWTNKFITSQDRKQYIWVRGRLFLGIIEMPTMFSPVVISATGSGIAPCMAFLQTHPNWPVRIVWSARSPVSTYGDRIISTVLKADPKAIIIDTKVTGRPNLPALIYAAYKEINAEAVLCVSTVKVCETVLFELEARGIPTFVPIFDS